MFHFSSVCHQLTIFPCTWSHPSIEEGQFNSNLMIGIELLIKRFSNPCLDVIGKMASSFRNGGQCVELFSQTKKTAIELLSIAASQRFVFIVFEYSQ